MIAQRAGSETRIDVFSRGRREDISIQKGNNLMVWKESSVLMVQRAAASRPPLQPYDTVDVLLLFVPLPRSVNLSRRSIAARCRAETYPVSAPVGVDWVSP